MAQQSFPLTAPARLTLGERVLRKL